MEPKTTPEQLEIGLREIDKEYYGGKEIEITYFDLIIQYINYAKEYCLEKAQNSLDFRWLGGRRRILSELINEQISIEQISIEQIFTKYLDQLKNILKEKNNTIKNIIHTIFMVLLIPI